jgi:DNA mismatch repair protein MutL
MKESPKPAASPEGTVIEVRQLFYNVPARRKFLKSAVVETDHVREVVRRLALSYPAIAFRFTRDGQTDLVLPAAAHLKERAAALFESGIAQDWIAIERSEGGLDLRGLAAPPRHSRTTASGEYVFVNGRFVRDRLILRAVQDAYREFLVGGRYPITCLFLTLPPEKVDVNVHPAKAEVRFADSNAVYQLFQRTLHSSLGGASLGPSLKAEDLEPKFEDRLVNFFAGPSVEQRIDSTPSIPRLQTEQRYFQLHQKYLIQEVGDGILIIDQHALHERCLLEKLRASYRSADMVRQKLLLPVVLQVSENELVQLEQHRRLLESIGIEYEEFGRQAIRVQSVPALLAHESPEVLVRDFLELCRERPSTEGEDLLAIEHVLEMMACRSAIKFGRALPPQEIEALLADRETLMNPHSCAHGRPVAVKLSLDELERFFRRK